MSFYLSRDDRFAIDTTLANFLEMDEENREKVIDGIETGAFCVYGYGSLLGKPHDKFDAQFAAYITEHRRDAVFSDRHYRGTPDRLGITLGLEPTQDPQDRVHGLVRVVRFQGDESDYVGRVHKSLKEFVKRETSLNPIYEYQAHTATILESESQIIRDQFDKVTAIVCGTNRDNPQYIGPTLAERDPNRPKLLSKWEKAAVIATCYGSDDAHTPFRTGMDYWWFVLKDLHQYGEKYGIPPDHRLVEFVQIANALRSLVPKPVSGGSKRSLSHQLTDREDANKAERSNYPAMVFEINQRAKDRITTYDTLLQNRKQAFDKMGRVDPLLADRRMLLEQRMLELADATQANG